VKPSEFPDVAEHAHLRDFLSRHFEMQVEDVRSMLRLPIEEQGLNGGCNFAAVNILSDLVAVGEIHLRMRSAWARSESWWQRIG
jgi:hypothetical protein